MEEVIIKCAVIDDSNLQRLAVIKMINDHPNLLLVGEYGNAIETKNGLLETKVDLIFLDIEMPILSGFDLLDDLIYKPQVVFVTGKTKYAYKAFNYNALDYLQKPITKDSFTNAVHKAVSLHRLKTEGKVDDNDNEYIFVKNNLKKKKIILNELKYITALGDYVKLVTVHDDSIIVLATMKSFVEQLPPERFMRIHKSYIVNVDKVEKYNSRNIEIDGESIPVSRHKKAALVEALNR